MKKLLILFLFVNISAAQTYKYGDKSKEIRKIQMRLINLGYITDQNGIFGIKTKFAVIAFQKVNNIKVDGIVGEETLKKLDNPSRPAPNYKNNPDHIEVDLKRQVLYLVENKRIKYIIPISSGKRNSTIKGRFKIYKLKKGWHKVMGKPWSGFMHNPIYFYKAYAIHGYKSVPNYPASHGCIRIPLCYSDFLFEYIKSKNVKEVYIY